MSNLNIGTGIKKTLLGFRKDSQGNKWPLPLGYRALYMTSLILMSISLFFYFLFIRKGIGPGLIFWFVISLIALLKDKKIRKKASERMPESDIDKHIKYKKNEAKETEIISAAKKQVIIFYLLWALPIILPIIGVLLTAAFGTN